MNRPQAQGARVTRSTTRALQKVTLPRAIALKRSASHDFNGANGQPLPKKPAIIQQRSESAGPANRQKIKSNWLKRSQQLKQQIPLDERCEENIKTDWHVYQDDSGVNFTVVLIKPQYYSSGGQIFYTLYLLENDKAPLYGVWTRFGKLGCEGRKMFYTFEADLERAKRIFYEKFYQRMHCDWTERDKKRKPVDYQCYNILRVDTNPAQANSLQQPAANQNLFNLLSPVKQPVDQKVKALMQLMDIVKGQSDTGSSKPTRYKPNPFGRLNVEHLMDGYKALKRIDIMLGGGGNDMLDFEEASNEFYFSVPVLFQDELKTIKTYGEVRSKLRMLHTLGDLSAAVESFGAIINSFADEPGDAFGHLNCQITPMEPNSDDYKKICEYLENSHASAHRFKVAVSEIFQLHKEQEHLQFIDYTNNTLLWHGSKTLNFKGILGQGLRIAPDGVAINGHMFGKGIYFADRVTKSAQYCFTTATQQELLLLLCEVSLGNSLEVYGADANVGDLLFKDTGYHSVKGVGQYRPLTIANWTTLSDGVIVPSAKTELATDGKNYSLLHNEYIVFKHEQVKMRYLVRAEVK